MTSGRLHDPRPPECCGVCPEVVSGGYDCTCRDNPRCPGPKEKSRMVPDR